MRTRSMMAMAMLALSGPSCRAGRVTASEVVEKPAPAERAAKDAPLESARRLALATTRENTATDRRIAALAQAARRVPQKVDAWIELGRAWVQKARETSDPGFYLNADACAEVALDRSPHDPLALDLRGLVLLNNHEFRRARDLAAGLVADHPDSPMAWGSLSDALLELGDVEQAERAALTMMDLKPNLPSYSRASYFQWLHGDTKSALESARLALDAGRDANHPEPRAWVLVQAAMLFWHEGDYDGADAGFQRALDAVSEYPPALVGRGKVAMAKGAAARAAELFERAYRQSPLVETAWLLGAARAKAGDVAGADDAFSRAEKDGKRSDRRTLSLMYATRNTRVDDALRLAEQEHRERADVYTEDALAFALYRNGRTGEASRINERWRAYGSRDARLLFHRGAIDIAAGRAREGKQLLAAALAQNPGFDVDGAAEAKRLLEEK